MQKSLSLLVSAHGGGLSDVSPFEFTFYETSRLLLIFFHQGILLVYDITNRWSFDGIDRWIKEIDEVS